jgi:CBS-domain-containing membrane protein
MGRGNDPRETAAEDSARDAARGAAREPSTSTVSDVMTRSVVATSRLNGFKKIAQTMHEWHVSALPVLEADGRVIGVVSEADLLPKEYRRHIAGADEPRERAEELLKSGGLTADELMTSPAVSVHADAQLTEAARIMARMRVKRMPVVDGGGRLAGIVSRSDLLKVFLRGDEEIAEEIRRDVLGLLPGDTSAVQVRVEKGVATVTGSLPDPSLVPVTARLVRSVEGVVDVRFAAA